MNIKTLQCVEVASKVSNGSRPVTMKPCDLDLAEQTLSCNRNGLIRNGRQRKNVTYLATSSGKVLFTILTRGLQFWYKYPNAKICTGPNKYKGIYIRTVNYHLCIHAPVNKYIATQMD